MAKKSDPKELARTYETLRQSIVARVKDPKARQQALARFDSDPRAQKLRRAAGLAPVTTRQRDLRDVARANVARESKAKKKTGSDFSDAMIAATSEAMFGIPERVEAAGRYFLPETSRDKRKGTVRRGASYDETLELVRAENEAKKDLSLAGNITGLVGGSIAGGMGVSRAITATGARLATAASPTVARAGNVLQKVDRALTVQRGQTGRNALRLVGTGVGYGTAQAAGAGTDIAEGAGYGAAAGAGLGVAGKVAPWLGGKAAEVFRMSGADAIFRRYTKTTREALEARAADFRKRTGTEPTIYELLDLEDRKSLQDIFQRLNKPQQERGATMARERVEAIPGEVAQVVRNATRGQRKENISNLASAQAEARGGAAATTQEARLAVGAAENPTRLAQLRRKEARSIMAPFDDQRPVDSVNELVPTELRATNPNKPGEISEVEIDPELSSVIRAAAGLAKIRPSDQGITVREITDMISRLKEAAAGKGSVIEQGAAQRAADHLESVLAEKIPDLAPALARMNENWAARSRQIEGMAEIRPQADVNPNSLRNLRRSENVFETPEGGVGRAMGQRGALIDDLGAATSPALGTVRTLAESPTAARQIAQNIGVPATRNITDAAAAQSESARRLATAVRDPSFDASEIEAGDLALLAAALNPASMAYTKANAIARVYQRLAKSIPESQSRTIVDMLFSRDPAMTQRAINALRSQGDEGGKVLQEIVAMAGMASAGDGEAPEAQTELPQETGEPDLSQLSDEELLAMYEGGGEQDLSQMSDEELLAMYEGGGTGGEYDADLEVLMAEEDPALLDLIDRVSTQESGGQQFDANGNPLESSAGAIGVMQVMPQTGPEAAEMAGLPWDEQAYYSDPAYNKLIGTAYLSEMLRRYDGDVELALVAYNAGPRRADAYKSGKINFSALPAETQNYVARIMK
jgi:hypothetical protein